MTEDRVIRAGDAVVGVRDHGGTGAPIVLLHGAGADRTAFDAVAAHLVRAHRTVAVDLRGHGLSGTGPWTFDGVLDDLEVAVAALRLDRPAVVGHSVGGLVAARWTRRHPDCPAAVSLDGHRVAGADPAHLQPAPGDDPQALAEAGGKFAAWLDAFFGTAESGLEPERAAASAAARAALRDDDLASFRGLQVPLLMVIADSDPPGLPGMWAPMMTAFRAGLRRDLADRPRIELAGIGASHGMVTERPAEVAAIVTRFLEPSR